MSHYSIDQDSGELVCQWPTRLGSVSTRICSPEARGELPLGLARTLTGLASELWRCYTHPASAAGSIDVNTEGWRRQKRREGFDQVVEHIWNPNLPDVNGSLVVSYDPVEEWAHRVGRQVHQLAQPELVVSVTAEVERELQAVESAELGDFAGRAAQAVLLTREDVSPVQLVAAEEALAEDPFGSSLINASFDPTTACAAAARYLRAAALVAADASGVSPSMAVMEADNIEALPHETPSAVLELLLETHASPTDVVTHLVQQAMSVAEGTVDDVSDAQAAIDHAAELEDRIRSYNPDDTTHVPVRLTTLDVSRPAPDMLEDLLTGIYGCWMLWADYNYSEFDHGEDLDLDAEPDPELEARMRHAFCDAIRLAVTDAAE